MKSNPAKQRSLTQEKICQAAIEVIHSEGIAALSMRRLAEALQVEAASLYNHIQNKSALLDLVQETLIKQLPSLAESDTWQNYLIEFAHSMRQSLLRYPNMVPLFASRPSITTSALAQTEKTFAILRNAGFSYAEVIFAYQSLCVFILGHLQAEVGQVPGASKEESEPPLNFLLDAKKYPHLVKAYTHSEGGNFDRWFQFGVTLLITGLENILLSKAKRKKS